MTFNPEAPLQKIENESAAANRALRDYYGIGARRSIDKLHALYVERTVKDPLGDKPPSTKMWTLNSWSTNHQWVARVKAQNEICEKEEEAVWRERAVEIRRADDEDAQKLRALALTILAQGKNFIKTKTKLVRGEGGEPDQKIITVSLNGNLAVQALQLASKLQRTSANVSDPAQEINIKVEKELKTLLDVLERNLTPNKFNEILVALGDSGQAEETSE